MYVFLLYSIFYSWEAIRSGREIVDLYQRTYLKMPMSTFTRMTTSQLIATDWRLHTVQRKIIKYDVNLDQNLRTVKIIFRMICCAVTLLL